MRILHTSDWHLGATLKHASRQQEHDAFLGWLLETLKEREIDVLLIAGDLFHTMNPPADALSAYYHFLARASRLPLLRQVVVIGGNHDSPSRLNAPEAVLSALDVHVVGGWGPGAKERAVVPIRDTDGNVDLVVCAVPFVHEYRLGVRTAGRSAGDIQFDLRREFSAIYDGALDRALPLANGAPIVAMGHLTCRGAQPDDYQSAIHLSGSVDAFQSDLFKPEYSYVALGHIHRMIPVEGDRVRYSGTPVPLGRKESRSQRYVLQVEFEAGEPDIDSEFIDDNTLRSKVTPIEVPLFRPLFDLRGTLEEVVAEIRALTWDTELLPYVLVRVVAEERVANVARRIDEALQVFPEDARPRLVDVSETLVRKPGEKSAKQKADPPLSELTPEQVFRRLYASKNDKQEPPEALLLAFRSLLTEEAT